MSEGDTNEIIGQWELNIDLLLFSLVCQYSFSTLVYTKLVAINVHEMPYLLETLPKYSLG
jgi:hypothetical protein